MASDAGALHATVLVVISAYAGEVSRSNAYDAGADAVLEKPVTPDAVCALVLGAVQSRAASPHRAPPPG